MKRGAKSLVFSIVAVLLAGTPARHGAALPAELSSGSGRHCGKLGTAQCFCDPGFVAGQRAVVRSIVLPTGRRRMIRAACWLRRSRSASEARASPVSNGREVMLQWP